jgi:hypothetical protein
MGEIMKNLLRKIFGLDQLEEAVVVARQKLEEAEKSKQEVEASLQKALKEEELAKLTPKERATAKGEPWVAVLDTHVNKDNIRNGFFELDWNAEFVLQLKQAGYGFDGDPDEEIVDRWFRDLARNILGEEGQDTTRGAGFINVIPISKGKSEVS